MTGYRGRRFFGSVASSALVALAAGLVMTAGLAPAVDAAAPTSIAKAPEVGKADRESEAASRKAEPAEQDQAVKTRRESAVPAYQPPRRGAPRARVGGGLRGVRALPNPLALAPDHVGQTVVAQPSLFWYIDGSPGPGKQLVFTLIDEESIEPLVEVALAAPKRSGIWRVRLADYGVRLAPGQEYEWSVALIPDPAQRSKDVVSSGYIRRVAAPEKLERCRPDVDTYADLGLWYDALESISDSIDAAPSDPVLRGQRNALLRQAKLDAAIE
jgi:hypothetical protein